MALKYNDTIIEVLPQLLSFSKDLEKISSPKNFNLCHYKNGIPGEGVTESRVIFKVKIIDKLILDTLLRTLPRDEELAFLSLVTFNNHRHHIPLIDFSLPESSQYVMEETFYSMKKKYGGEIYIFKSGRSFHGYHTILLNHKNWCDYLGDLLLLNKKDQSDEIIDTRWVGHCIKQGFASLRLSHNTLAYIQSPKFVMKI